MSMKRLVRCTVGHESFCIDNDWLDSIQVIENLYPSRSADGSIGWIRRFDEKVPVFRLADQLYGATSRTPSRSGVIIVLRREERLWALLVDKVHAATEIPLERIHKLPAVVGDADTGQFPSVVVEDEGLSLYLAPERLVPVEVSGAEKPQPRTPTLQSFIRARPRPSTAARPAGSAPMTSGHKESARIRRIITFALEHEATPETPVRFGVSAGQAIEIASGLPLIPVPNAPSFVIGLAKWRLTPLPVIDLGAWMGIGGVFYTPGCRLLICRGASLPGTGGPSLMAIPAVDELRKLDLPIEYKPWPTRPRWNPALALGIYQAERTMLVFPDLDAMLGFQAPPPGYRM